MGIFSNLRKKDNKKDDGTKSVKGDVGLTGTLPTVSAALSTIQKKQFIKPTEIDEYIIEMNGAIPFNTTEVNDSSSNIIFNTNNTVTLYQPGIYTFQWWFDLEGVDTSVKQIVITLEATDLNEVVTIQESRYSVMTIGLITGQNMLVKSDYEPMTARIVNMSTGSIKLNENIDIIGSLKIIRFSI